MISWGSPSSGNKIAWRCSTIPCTRTPVMPRRSMIDPDDYVVRTLAQLMSSASSNQVRISIGPTSTQLKSQLRSHISSYSDDSSDLNSSPSQNPGYIHQIHISPDAHMNSRFILICEHNLSRLWVPPRTTHTRACELGGSGGRFN